MSKTRIAGINALEELERFNWAYFPHGDNEVQIKCPTGEHSDDVPSASLNIEKNLWSCHACKARGDIITLLAHIGEVKRETILIELSKRYNLEDVKSINPENVERMHDKVWEAGPLLHALRERGVTDQMIRSARLGYHSGRITIPVYDQAKRVLNIRRYLPGATARKMLNTRGYSEARLYQIDQVIQYDDIWICGGEIKALVVGGLLNDKKIGACSATAGEGTWNPDWSPYFRGKRVFICMDIDAVGISATNKIARSVALTAQSVKIVTLPLDRDTYPKGDVNDYIGKEKATAEDLIRLMSLATELEVSAAIALVKEKGHKEILLKEVDLPENEHYRLSFNAVVSAMGSESYRIPKEINVS